MCQLYVQVLCTSCMYILVVITSYVAMYVLVL